MGDALEALRHAAPGSGIGQVGRFQIACTTTICYLVDTVNAPATSARETRAHDASGDRIARR